VYVGGVFNSIGGQPRTNLAVLNRTDGTATTWNPGTGPFSRVNALVLSGGILYVGGGFNRIAGQFQTNIAALNTTTQTPLTWSNNANGIVSCLALSGSTLYVSGSFTRIGGAPNRVNAAALNT